MRSGRAGSASGFGEPLQGRAEREASARYGRICFIRVRDTNQRMWNVTRREFVAFAGAKIGSAREINCVKLDFLQVSHDAYVCETTEADAKKEMEVKD